jgi:hypothetical protein
MSVDLLSGQKGLLLIFWTDEVDAMVVLSAGVSFFFAPNINITFRSLATLQRQLTSDRIHGSSPMISDICP